MSRGIIMTKSIIGLIGAGCLGEALMHRFSVSCKYEYLVCDICEEKALKVSECTGSTMSSIDSMVKHADYIFMALPMAIIEEFIIKYENKFKSNCVLINLSTSLNTLDLQKKIHRSDLEVIGLKPVCQASALKSGGTCVFYSSSSKSKHLDVVKNILKPLGKVFVGDEMLVSKINEYATLCSLELIIKLEKYLKSLGVDDEVKKAAVVTVAGGTLMDYPYNSDNFNDYIKNLVEKYQLELC